MLPGEAAAKAALSGPSGFLTPQRLSQYATKRNDPTCPHALSGLSPYLHYGQVRCCLPILPAWVQAAFSRLQPAAV